MIRNPQRVREDKKWAARLRRSAWRDRYMHPTLEFLCVFIGNPNFNRFILFCAAVVSFYKTVPVQYKPLAVALGAFMVFFWPADPPTKTA